MAKGTKRPNTRKTALGTESNRVGPGRKTKSKYIGYLGGSPRIDRVNKKTQSETSRNATSTGLLRAKNKAAKSYEKDTVGGFDTKPIKGQTVNTTPRGVNGSFPKPKKIKTGASNPATQKSSK